MNKIYCLYRRLTRIKHKDIKKYWSLPEQKQALHTAYRLPAARQRVPSIPNNLHVTTHQFNFLNNQTYYPTCYLLSYLKLYSKEKNMNVNQITITLRDGLCLKSLKEIDRLDYLAVTGQLSNLHRLLKYKLKDQGLSMAFQRTNMKRIHSRPKWNEL